MKTVLHSLIIGTALAVLVVACIKVPHTPAAPAASLSGNAYTDGISVFGTLAPMNSFSFEAAPIYTRVAVVGHQTAAKLRRGEITIAQAQAIYDAANQAKTLADSALTACMETAKGKCSGDQAKAESLLAQSRAALQGASP